LWWRPLFRIPSLETVARNSRTPCDHVGHPGRGGGGGVLRHPRGAGKPDRHDAAARCASEEDIARLTAHYGLDKTIFEQFWIWLTGVFHGDFGTSISLRQPVMPLVLGRLPATLELAIFALVIAVVIGGAWR
jgi:ABC-type microcin C transport system permease subunit YejB